MTTGLFLLLSFIVSMSLVLRIRNKVTRIFSVAATGSYFLVMTVMAAIPSSEISQRSSLFISFVFIIGIVFTLVALINTFYQNLNRKSESENVEESGKEP